MVWVRSGWFGIIQRQSLLKLKQQNYYTGRTTQNENSGRFTLIESKKLVFD